MYHRHKTKHTSNKRSRQQKANREFLKKHVKQNLIKASQPGGAACLLIGKQKFCETLKQKRIVKRPSNQQPILGEQPNSKEALQPTTYTR